jgi:hypothetical protein
MSSKYLHLYYIFYQYVIIYKMFTLAINIKGGTGPALCFFLSLLSEIEESQT